MILGSMAKGTRDFKKLEGMIKKVDQTREKDSTRIDANLEEIKAMIHGLVRQHNKGGANRGSILGNSGFLAGDSVSQQNGNQHGRYTSKLEFPKFHGEGVDEWIFKVEHFFP